MDFKRPGRFGPQVRENSSVMLAQFSNTYAICVAGIPAPAPL